MSLSGKGIFRSIVAVVFLLVITYSNVLWGNVSAAQITARSLTLQAGVTDDGSKPGGVVNHLLNFSVGSTASVGSVQFLYCTIAVGTCVTPTGLSSTSATLGTQTGATGFSLVNTTNGAPYLSRTAASITSGTALAYQLLAVTNPTTTNQTFFVRISTFASTNATGSPIDTGTVAASTATQITVSGIMPESLIFCTGGTISAPGGIPDCSTATGGSVSFNQLFSPTDTATATSQMAASTNAASGYNVTVNGQPLTSGSNTITSMSASTTTTHGLSQFGFNLRANTSTTSTPTVGADVAPVANGINYKGQAMIGYNAVDNFKFVSGDSVADSANGGAGGTDAQLFTMSYIVDVPGSQSAGTYTTTLTYICTPTF